MPRLATASPDGSTATTAGSAGVKPQPGTGLPDDIPTPPGAKVLGTRTERSIDGASLSVGLRAAGSPSQLYGPLAKGLVERGWSRSLESITDGSVSATYTKLNRQVLLTAAPAGSDSDLVIVYLTTAS